MTGTIFLTIDPAISSPSIQKGTPARKFWLYQRRIERLCLRKTPTQFDSFAISEAVTDAMSYCEELGYTSKEDDYGRPHWFRPDGTMVMGYPSDDPDPQWFTKDGRKVQWV